MATEDAAYQVSLEVVYVDEHLLQLRCRVTVGEWSGQARAYTTQGAIRTLANDLRRFGESLRGQSRWEAGADNGIGLIGLHLYCVNRAGHIACHVRLASDTATEHRPKH